MWWKSLIGFIRKFLRIICLLVFLHWITFTTYANCTNYQDSINRTDDHKEIKKIEEDILHQISKKKNREIPHNKYKWKNGVWSDKLKGLKEENKTKKYNDELKNCKEDTISNIREQLEQNDLSITELDDERTLFERFWNDPLKFFFISPLNKISKELQLSKTSSWGGEIFFKLVMVKLIYLLVIYPEIDLNSLQENSAKLQDSSLSLEEKEQINKDFSPWPMIFNLFIAFPLLNIFTPLNPSFVDQTNPAYSRQTSFFSWLLPIILVGVLSSISSEFVRQKRVLKFKEIKNYLVKNWVVSLIAAPLLQFVFVLFFGRRNYGGYLFSICSGLVEFTLNMVKVVFFRGKGGKTPSSKNPFRKTYRNS